MFCFGSLLCIVIISVISSFEIILVKKKKKKKRERERERERERDGCMNLIVLLLLCDHLCFGVCFSWNHLVVCCL